MNEVSLGDLSGREISNSDALAALQELAIARLSFELAAINYD